MNGDLLECTYVMPTNEHITDIRMDEHMYVVSNLRVFVASYLSTYVHMYLVSYPSKYVPSFIPE
jgi:hypothetical protein